MTDCRHTVRTLLLSVLLLALAATGVVAADGPVRLDGRARRAAALVAKATQHLALRTIEGRRLAIGELEQAVQLQPLEAEYELQLARAYAAAGYARASRKAWERVVALTPDDPDAQFGLGQIWRRDWLKYLEGSSLRQAIEHFEAAARLDSTMVDAWLLLASLRTAHDDSLGAASAAQHALRCAPALPEAQLAVAAARWHLGDVDGAEAAYRLALPRLARSLRQHFEDFAPVATEADTAEYNHLPAGAKAEYARRFWTDHDPDPTTVQNEAQLEYWTRVTEAYFLFFDPKRRDWDERGEIYVRYGPPSTVDYNPLGTLLYGRVGTTSQMMYPMNVLVWGYPELGMTVALQDRTLSETYMLPTATDHDPDPRPDPDAVAARGDVGTHELRGVFRALPPGAVAVPVQGQVARFQNAGGGHVFAALEAPSSPGDSLVATAVVLDSTGRERTRLTRPLSPSACSAATARVADFATDLPPGHWVVGLSVHAGRRRGSVRMPIDVRAPDTTLALSDLVLTCGTPIPNGTSVRLDANPSGRSPAGTPLTAYFEIYQLTPDARGEAHFEYEYRVRSARRDPRIWIQRALAPRGATPEVQAFREETNVGGMRRQFVSVPVSTLPAGRYRLEVRVRDTVSGAEASRSTEFVRGDGSVD